MSRGHTRDRPSLRSSLLLKNKGLAASTRIGMQLEQEAESLDFYARLSESNPQFFPQKSGQRWKYFFAQTGNHLSVIWIRRHCRTQHKSPARRGAFVMFRAIAAADSSGLRGAAGSRGAVPWAAWVRRRQLPAGRAGGAGTPDFTL